MNDQPRKLRISDMLHAVYKHRILIAALTGFGLIVGILLSVMSYMRGEMTKEFAITSSIAVTSQLQNGMFTSDNKSPNSTDFYLAENMVDAVIYVMKSDQMLDSAIKRLNLIGVTVKDIADNLTLSQYHDTQIIEMTLLWRNADEGVQILAAINSVAPNVLISTLKLGSVSVVNQPTARYRIGGSVNLSMWIYTALLGLMAGIGISMFNLLLNPTLVNVSDLEDYLGLEVLGKVPRNGKYFRRKAPILEVDNDNPGTDVWESFASTAMFVQNRLGMTRPQCIYVTSSVPNEGKTSAAAHLAVKLSDLEKKVLLIDFDVSNPSLGTRFLKKIHYEHSLNALFRGEAEKEDAITHLTAYLDLLPAILEPAGLPIDEAMLDLVRKLSQDYDYVLMDTAPVGQVSMTMNLNKIVNTVLFVVQYDSTKLNDVRDALERLNKSGVRVMGAIVNGIEKMSRESYYGYHYTHHYPSGTTSAKFVEQDSYLGPEYEGERDSRSNSDEDNQ